GRVSVEFADGEPAYEIVHPVAFDAIAVQSSPVEFDWLYHGSLALRADASRKALERLASRRTFLDVNLRSPWWSRESVLDRVRRADWVKLNLDELEQLTGQRADHAATELVESCDLEGLLVTSGSRGARILTAGGETAGVAPRRQIEVVDTVGAGDAFAAVTIFGLTRDWRLDDLLERAQQFASAICGQRGATIKDPSFYARFLAEWGLEKATD
ncbi:MAG: PfkB family carbohydrate kinase, partial [Xanthomonadales bacterium]|nr:PfkB family carbohydrate kinase [Xanthomonadales bacterium]